LARAVTQSYDARESVATSLQREAEADAALGRLLPALSARGTYTRNQYEFGFQGATIQRKNQLDALVQLDVPLLDLASYHRYRAQSALSRVATEQQAITSLDIARAVARGYYQFIGASALVRSARLSVELAEANYRNVEDRRGAGTATNLDSERALANVERARQDVADAELTLDLESRSLETLSGVRPEAATEYPNDDLHPEPPLERWEALAQETPEDRAARAAEQAQLENQRAAARALYPTLTATGQEHFTRPTAFSGNQPYYYTLLVVAAIRLDYATVATSRAQELATEVQRIRQQKTRRAVLDSVFEAYRRVQAGIVKSRAARSQAAAAGRAAELALDRYTAGVATQLDVTQAQRDAFLADASRIQADADLSYARAALRLAVGQMPAGVSGGARRAP
jgi:outer membrane protein TolC